MDYANKKDRLSIAVLGTGYVGLVTGVCLAQLGHDVVCVDRDPAIIRSLEKGVAHFYEPGLDDALKAEIASGNLRFSRDVSEASKGATVVFVAVGTPMGKDGRADLSHVEAAAKELAEACRDGVIIAVKSTVPVGSNEKIRGWVKSANPGLGFDVVSNPEFLREGCALKDFLEPDRIVVGVEGVRASEIMAKVYDPLINNGATFIQTGITSAEMIKYASNAFLAMKVGFVNQVSDMCEALGADIVEVARGIGSDPRIGSRFLNAGPGYGGSCFPKDTNAFVESGREAGVNMSIIGTVVEANNRRKREVAERVAKLVEPGGKIGVLGVTFKAGTDDMREAPSLTILPTLTEQGFLVRAYDPKGRASGEPLLPDVVWKEDAYDVAQGADLLLVLTEWSEFKNLDLRALSGVMRKAVLFDTRGVFNDLDATDFGFLRHISVGRKPLACKLP